MIVHSRVEIMPELHQAFRGIETGGARQNGILVFLSRRNDIDDDCEAFRSGPEEALAVKIVQGVFHGLEPRCDLCFIGWLRQGVMIAAKQEQRFDIAEMLVAIKMVRRVGLGPAQDICATSQTFGAVAIKHPLQPFQRAGAGAGTEGVAGRHQCEIIEMLVGVGGSQRPEGVSRGLSDGVTQAVVRYS